MYYYEVWVSSQRYHSDKPLTYSYDHPLEPGSIVAVPLQRQTVVAIIDKKVSKPKFNTKNIPKVIEDTPAPPQIIALIRWLMEYYPSPSGQIVSLFVPSILSAKSRKSPEIESSKGKPIKLPPLSKDQINVMDTISDVAPRSVLLHGDTGTGKTRVYLELAKKSLESHRSVILLTPEISLTPQLAINFQQTFPDQTVVIHSELSDSSRRNIWLQILKSNKPLVVIGPRSALFVPLKNIGAIIIDEFHEPSYKQEQAPRYQSTRVGAKLAELHGAQLILGSATPPVSDYYTFDAKGLPIARMTEPAIKKHETKSKVKIVDLKERKLFNRSPWISDTLIDTIKQAIKANQQSLIFLNRRGTARLVFCQECGWQAFCPRCDLPLTYHGDSHSMQCHTCGHTEKTPVSCSDCSSNDIIFRSIGTKSIVSELERLIPGAGIARFDSDTSQNDRLSHKYSSVKEGSVDILVGTQMLGKGLDLPKLSVVGIITAETSLAFPDYTAEERTFQLITQAIGRVNRGHVPGTAIVQTHHPDSPLIQAAVSKDYQALYEQQIAERQLFKFPPFRFLLKLSCARASSASAQKTSAQLATALRQSNLPIEIIGPSPAFTEKSHGKYHWQIIVKANKRQALTQIIKNLPANWTYDIDPLNLL